MFVTTFRPIVDHWNSCVMNELRPWKCASFVRAVTGVTGSSYLVRPITSNEDKRKANCFLSKVYFPGAVPSASFIGARGEVVSGKGDWLVLDIG